MNIQNKTTKNIRDQGLDKFYTLPKTVDYCLIEIEKLYKWNNWNLIIEPSAGNGSFYNKIPTNNKIGFDILPEHKDIIKKDFLKLKLIDIEKILQSTFSKILVVGNPPFGKISSLAIQFFNKASEYATVIAFIIPRTFRKISVQNKLNQYFHLIQDIEIPTNPCSFQPQMSVKCCFQIWERKNEKREIKILQTVHEHWTFLGFGILDNNGQPTPPNDADFAIRAYGGKIGIIVDNIIQLKKLRPKSWHWIKVTNINKDILINRFKSLDFSNSQNTARQNSCGKAELIQLYNNYIMNI